MILFSVFEESFSLLDKDGDGNISNYEIRSLMNSLGYSPSEEDISSVIAKVDIDGKFSPQKNTQTSFIKFNFL
jgi:calmodulin